MGVPGTPVGRRFGTVMTHYAAGMSNKSSAVDVNTARDRLGRAASAAARFELAGLLVSPGSDLQYLIGAGGQTFERLSALAIPADGTAPTLVLPKLEELGFADVPVAELGIELATWVDGEDPYALVARACPGAGQVGIVDAMPALHSLRLRDAMPGSTQVLAGPVIRELRMRKDSAEIAALREAGAAIDRVHARMGEFLRVGRTEREVGRDIEAAMIEEGHTRAAFIIVGSGPNGASPHHEVSDRVIEAGDVVVVDIGGPVAAGYFSDCTRMYSMGRPAHADVAETYAVLQAAQDAACAAIRPGVTAESIDAAARNPIAEAGFGEYFVHRTGHGIGMDVHEEPYIMSGNDIELAPGMAFSVEPGVYLPGRWGARIEDIVVVTEDGVERLNNQPRDLIIL